MYTYAVRLAVKGQRYHDDLSGNGDGQLLFVTLVNDLHAVEEDDTHQSHNERADVSAGDVFTHSDETLHMCTHTHTRTHDDQRTHRYTGSDT